MKNRVIAISYADDNYSMSKKLNLFTAKLIGRADEIISYGPEDLSEEFIEKNKEILSYARGGGYWIWKPYIILKTFEKMKDGEFLIYTDAGMIYIRSIYHMIRQIDRDGVDCFFSSGFVPAKDWCKRDCFYYMDCDNEEAKNNIMVSGGYILLRKSRFSIELMEEFLRYASDARIITDNENTCGLPNSDHFIQHRHDQSVLSNLVWKHGIIPYKAVTHVDEPREHIDAYRTGNAGAYHYTFEERVKMMLIEHQSEGYKKSDYGRLFINTRLRNQNIFLFGLRLIYRICYTAYSDIWGWIHERKIFDDVKKRME